MGDLDPFCAEVEGATLSFLEGHCFITVGGYADDILLGVFTTEVEAVWEEGLNGVSLSLRAKQPPGQWRSVATPPELYLEGHTAVTIAGDEGGAILLFGGQNEDLLKSGATHRMEYSALTKGLTITTNVPCTGSLPLPRSRHCAAATSTHMYIFGGDSQEGGALNDTFSLELDAFVWTMIISDVLPSRRLLSAMIVAEGNSLYLLGGTGYDTDGVTHKDCLDVCWRFDIAASQWHMMSELTIAPRNGHTAVRGDNDDGPVVLLGGKGAWDPVEGEDRILLWKGGASLSLRESLGDELPHWTYMASSCVVSGGGVTTTTHASWPLVVAVLGGDRRHPNPKGPKLRYTVLS